MSMKKEKVQLDAVVFAIYCAMAPLNMILNFTGATINKYIGILAAGCMLFSVISKEKFNVGTSMVMIVFFWLWAFCTALWTVSWGLTKSFMITLTSLVAVFGVGYIRGFNIRELQFIKNVMILAAAVLVFWITPNKDQSYFRGTLSSEAGSADQNGLAANILFPLWMALDTALKETGWKRLLYIVAAVCMLISIFLLGSRGALVALVVAAVAYFMNIKGKRIKLPVVLILIVAIFLIMSYLQENNPYLAERLSLEGLQSDAGNGRLYIWESTFKLLLDNPVRLLFGYGYGTEISVSELAMGSRIGTHNVYLEHWATMGLVGITLLLGCLFSILKRAVYRKDALSVALMVSMMVICMFLGFFKDKGAWNTMLLCTIGFMPQQKAKQDGAEHLENVR